VTGDTKVMVALGGWTWSHNFAAVAANETKRGVFAESVKGFLDEWKLDGIGEFTGVTVRSGRSARLTRLS
jgi:GH18 family chitinase